jgi:hypothetical protein
MKQYFTIIQQRSYVTRYILENSVFVLLIAENTEKNVFVILDFKFVIFQWNIFFDRIFLIIE